MNESVDELLCAASLAAATAPVPPHPKNETARAKAAASNPANVKGRAIRTSQADCVPRERRDFAGHVRWSKRDQGICNHLNRVRRLETFRGIRGIKSIKISGPK
jgi:hypothetical protein